LAVHETDKTISLFLAVHETDETVSLF